MSKIGRNTSCICGSGKKFKNCCIDSVQAQNIKMLNAKKTQSSGDLHHSFLGGHLNAPMVDDDADLNYDSNLPIDLINENKLDEAEIAAKKLLNKYPQLHDGFERLGLVYEAKGDLKLAAEIFQKAVNQMRTFDASNYDKEYLEWFDKKIAELKIKIKKK